jgi:hypothetical protein
MQQKLSGNKNFPFALISFNRILFFHILDSMQRSQMEPFVQEKPPRYTYPDPQAQAGRLQKQTDFLRFVCESLNFVS